MTVKMNAAALDDAISAATGLASQISSARTTCLTSIPPGGPELPSLGMYRVAGTAPEWLREQATDPLGVIRDLAEVLGSEDGSSVTWDGSTTGNIEEIKEELGRQIADDLDDIGDVNSPEDLARIQAAVDLLLKYGDDPDITSTVATTLGPDELGNLIEQAAAMTGPYSNYPNPNGDYGESTYADEYEKVVALQDGLASALSGALATASRTGGLPANYGSDLVESNGPLVSSIIFDYAHRNGNEFGTTFLLDAGDALLEWENGEGGMYWSNFPPNYQYGTADASELIDPTVQWMEALSDNTVASQRVLLDPEKAQYLLERFAPSEDPSGNAAGMVLQTATVDQALENNSYGQNAATISAWAIEHFGGSAKAQEGVNEELGGIIATYIRDADRVAYDTGSAEGSGTYGPDGLPGATNIDGEGFPPFGIQLNRANLENLLGDIGDNDEAVSLVGSAASRLNEIRLDQSIDQVAANGIDPNAPVGVDNPVYAATRSNAGFQGFLYNNLLEGGIADAREDAAQRQRLAKLLLLPTEYIKVPGGPVGSYVVGEIKTQLTNAFVGDGVTNTINESNDMFDDIQTYTRLQALHALVTSDAGLPTGDLADTWPVDDNGQPVPIDELTNTQQTALINMGNTGGNGYASGAISGAIDGRDMLIDLYGDS